MKKNKLSKEEKELLESLENDEWVSEFSEAEKNKYQQIAENTLLKNKRINIRMSERDLKRLKAKAAEEGLPYQSLITSILHKYLSGKFTET